MNPLLYQLSYVAYGFRTWHCNPPTIVGKAAEDTPTRFVLSSSKAAAYGV